MMPSWPVLFSIAIAAFCTALPAVAQERDPEAFRATLARLEAFRKAEFVKAGALSIDTIAASGRTVRRVMIRGFLPVRPPVMELERMASGEVFLSLIGDTGPVQRTTVDRSIWAELVAQDDAVFAEPRPAPPAPGPAPTTACHGDSIYFEATEERVVRTAGGVDCPRSFIRLTPAQRAAANLVIGVTLKTLGCPPATRDTGMALSVCLSRTAGKPESRASTGSERMDK